MEQFPLNNTALILPAVSGVIIFWLLICILISRLSGWHRLAGGFEATYQPAGQRFSFQSAQFRNLANYSGILTVNLSQEGLGLRVMWLFRAGHPPLFIPWDSVVSAVRVNQFLNKGVTLQIAPRYGDKPITVFLGGGRLAEAVWAILPQHLTRAG